MTNSTIRLKKMAFCCSLTYQTESLRGEISLLEERHGNLAGNNTQVSRIRGLKELIVSPFLLGREVQIGLS